MLKPNMNTTQFSQDLMELVSHSQGLTKAFDQAALIINSQAGALKNKKVLRANHAKITSLLKTLRTKKKGSEIATTIHLSHSSEENIRVTKQLIEDKPLGKKLLIIVGGGDGTSKDICSAFLDLSLEKTKDVVLFRLPLGTGNDNTDAETLEEAFSLWNGPVDFFPIKALRCVPRNMPVSYSFNAIGVGLDAFVVIITNAIKKRIPGQFYNFAVDIATLFFESIIKLKETRMKFPDIDEETQGKIIYSLIGAGGHKTVGCKKKILPGDDNICVTRTMNLWSKIKSKTLFYQGKHGDLPEVSFYSSRQIIIEYPAAMPIHLDGESFWLKQENFPLKIEVFDPGIMVMRTKQKSEG